MKASDWVIIVNLGTAKQSFAWGAFEIKTNLYGFYMTYVHTIYRFYVVKQPS